MQMYLIRISIIVCCFQLEFLVVYSGSCREERSQRGFALLNTTYGSKPVQRYPDCLDSCLTDPKCMSFNFWWDSRKCDMNTKVREHSCGACFVKDASSTYMGMARYPGYPGKIKKQRLKKDQRTSKLSDPLKNADRGHEFLSSYLT